MISYHLNEKINAALFRDILIRSTLGSRRPIHQPDVLQKMVEYGNLIITAKDNGIIIGIARSLTDFAYCTYLSDLAVDERYQKKGIGKELIRQTKLAAPQAKLILLSAPKAVQYYPRIGMKHHEYCFMLDDVRELK